MSAACSAGIRVHVETIAGDVVFAQLVEAGALLEFASGNGWVARSEIDRNGWRIVPGWVAQPAPTVRR